MGGECEVEVPHSVRRELEVRTITEEEVEKAVKMKTGKAVRVDELSLEMVKASGNQVADENVYYVLHNRRYTNNNKWRRGVIVPIVKGKGYIHDPGRYRSSTVLCMFMITVHSVRMSYCGQGHDNIW